MIVWMASYPRSGNTFARLVLQQMYAMPLPTVYLRPPTGDVSTNANARPLMFPELDCRVTLDEARRSSQMMLVKTHELPSDDAPALYLVRDGRDALVSHARYVLEFDLRGDRNDRAKFLEILRGLIETDNSFGGWGNNVLAWQNRLAPTAVIHFEKLIASPVTAMRVAFAQLKVPVKERQNYEVPKFSQLHDRAPNFFRRGAIGGWRDEMPDDLHELFWQRHGATMDALGYQRNGNSPVADCNSTSAA